MLMFAYKVNHPLGLFIGFVAAHGAATADKAAKKKWGEASELERVSAEEVTRLVKEENLKIAF